MRKLVVLGGAAVIVAAAACSSSTSTTAGTEVFQGRQALTPAEMASSTFTPTYPLAFTGPVATTATWSPPGGNATKITTTFKTSAGNLVVNADVPNVNNPPTTVNPTTCLSTSTITGTYTVVGDKSTGKFKGGTGSGKIVDLFVGTLPKLSSGKCNESQSAQPLPGAYTTFHASGPLTVTS
jgi:hypothetical protein